MSLFARWFHRGKTATTPSNPATHLGDVEPLRRLFLDDDPARAETFLAEYPDAVWVQTVADCLARLEEPWDEVHLDHDLGGEHFVDHARDDCGMEVVRWLSLVKRPHLRTARFYVHSHNPTAATTMGMALLNAGYYVELRPFGAPPLPLLPDLPVAEESRWKAVLGWLRRVVLRRPPGPYESYGYGHGYDSTEVPREGLDPDHPPLDRLDLGWARPGALLPRGTPQAEPPRPAPEVLDLTWASPPPPPAGPELRGPESGIP
jgi:hypothetical protein